MTLRPPETVMRLARMGAMHSTRLSLARAMLRRAAREDWRVARTEWAMAGGFGHAVYRIVMPQRTYSFVAFSQDLPAGQRTDRVIADAWDCSFVLYDGIPDATELARLRAAVPRQEAGRFTARELTLLRANRSVRLFDAVAGSLAAGHQPDRAMVEQVGYLMRTTAVYGNGKFGIADRTMIADRVEFAGPFQAEMLSVWLARGFTLDLVEHCARTLSPRTAAALEPDVRARFGMGNATGLGMAPFLVRHPLLLHNWMLAREAALARVRALPAAAPAVRAEFASHVAAAREAAAQWQTDDPVQRPRIATLSAELAALAGYRPAESFPWDSVYRWAEQNLSLEGQEATVALLLEPYGALVDPLCDIMAADEQRLPPINGTCADLRASIAETYAWALAIDHAAPDAQARFWYASAEKLEPRLGERASEPGADREQPLTVARDVAALHAALADAPDGETVAALLRRAPQWRHVVRRVQITAAHPYAEIRDNLISADLRPIDLLRCKLAMFGATRFDPRSDRWVRITLFQGAPFPSAEVRLGVAA